jgi:hypothetical protein
VKLGELTTLTVKRVLRLRDGKVALSDAVLAVVELSDDSVGTLGRGTVGSEGELAGAGQQDVNVNGGGGGDNSPERLGENASLCHGGEGSETENGEHGEGVGWRSSGLVVGEEV